MNVNRRPLSPHASIYRWPLNAVMSILHRATGVGLAVGAILAVWWLLAAATSEVYFGFVDSLLTSILGELVLVISLAALWYHCCNGIRHLIWDTGYGFNAVSVAWSGRLAIAAAIALTCLTILIIQ